MLEICFGTYLVLGLPAMLLLWMALAVSKMHRENDRQRQYHITLALASPQNARGKYDIAEDHGAI